MAEYWINQPPQFWFAQAFSLVATIIIVVSFQIKRKNVLLMLNVAANAFIFASLILLGAYLGAAGTAVAVIRGFVFFNMEKRPKWYNYTALGFICTLVVISVVLAVVLAPDFVFGFNFENLFSLIMLAAILVLTFGLWQKNTLFIRFASIFASVIFIVYNVIHEAYVIIILESLIIVSCLVFFIRFLIEKRREKNKTTPPPKEELSGAAESDETKNK